MYITTQYLLLCVTTGVVMCVLEHLSGGLWYILTVFIDFLITKITVVLLARVTIIMRVEALFCIFMGEEGKNISSIYLW